MHRIRAYLTLLVFLTAVMRPLPALADDCSPNRGDQPRVQCGGGGGGYKPPAPPPDPDHPRILVQGQETVWDNQPYIDPTTNRTLLPMRELSNKLGLNVEWDEDLRRIWINDGGDHLLGFKLDSNFMTHDGEYIFLDQGPAIRDSRAYLPARHLVEKMGGSIVWDAPNNTIWIWCRR